MTPHSVLAELGMTSVILTSQEPTITLRLNAIWGLPSLKVGLSEPLYSRWSYELLTLNPLVYLASAVPTLFCKFLIGSQATIVYQEAHPFAPSRSYRRLCSGSPRSRMDLARLSAPCTAVVHASDTQETPRIVYLRVRSIE